MTLGEMGFGEVCWWWLVRGAEERDNAGPRVAVCWERYWCRRGQLEEEEQRER